MNCKHPSKCEQWTTNRTFVTQTTTGTLKANAIAKCSFDIPIKPAFAPTMRITHEGAPEVSPYSVVFKYFSCPARSMKEMIFAACMDIASQLIFSCRMASTSFDSVAVGRMGSPVGPKPSIYIIRVGLWFHNEVDGNNDLPPYRR